MKVETFGEHLLERIELTAETREECVELARFVAAAVGHDEFARIMAALERAA